jgi:hypothetical protein
VKPNTCTIKLVFVASLLSMQHKGVRGNTGWLGFRIIPQSGTTDLPTKN